MKSRILIVAILVVVVALLGMAIFSLLSPQGESPITGSGNPALPTIEPAEGTGKILFQGSGGAVRMNNFYSSVIASSSDALLLFEDAEVGTVEFVPATRAFTIVTQAEYVEQLRRNRPILEGKLLEILGISQVDACKLPVFFGVLSIDPNLNGMELGLSFCPSGIPTP